MRFSLFFNISNIYGASVILILDSIFLFCYLVLFWFLHPEFRFASESVGGQLSVCVRNVYRFCHCFFLAGIKRKECLPLSQWQWQFNTLKKQCIRIFIGNWIIIIDHIIMLKKNIHISSTLNQSVVIMHSQCLIFFIHSFFCVFSS